MRLANVVSLKFCIQYIYQWHYAIAYSPIGQPDRVTAADSFITLCSKDLDWSDTNCTTDSDITDDELWSDDNTVINDGSLWDDNGITTDIVSTNTSLRNMLTCTSTNDDLLSQSEVLIPSNSDITTNEILEDAGSTNEITANDVSPNRSSESNITNNIVIPIEAPSILTYNEALEQTTQDGIQAMDSNTQPIVLLSRCSLPEDGNTCFDELADLPSSPENNMSSSKNYGHTTSANNMLDPTVDNASVIEEYLMEQLSAISSNEVDDDFVDEDLDWN